MAKIVCITSGLTGMLNASFDLVHRLSKQGFEVIYASPREVRNRVEAQGISYFQLPAVESSPEPEVLKHSGSLGKFRRWWFKVKNYRERKKQAMDRLRPEVFIDWVKKEKPDLLIIDIELHEYILSVYQLAPRLLLLSQWFSTWKRPGLPYLLTDTIPGKGWKGSPLIIDLSWRKVELSRWWIFTKKKWRSMGTDRRSVLFDLAKEQGFPLSYIRQNYWPGPFSYDVLPVLSMTAEELEFPHETRPNLFYIGPMVATDREDKPARSLSSFSLSEVLERRRKKDCRLIYCSLSTLSSRDDEFVQRLIAAVRDRKDWILLLSLGKGKEQEQYRQTPENVFAFEFVPQLKILRLADCSINHGGIHTINECIYHKVPMLIYSGKRSDQNGCAARVAYHGVGLTGDKDRDSAAEIQRKIEQVLQDQQIRKNINTLHGHFLAYKKNFVAARLITNFLAKSTKAEKPKLL